MAYYESNPAGYYDNESAAAPGEKLLHMFSTGAEISTTSSFASLMQESVGRNGIYRSIGAGTCGKVFEQLGSIFALKVSKYDNNSLWNDYQMHTRIVNGFSGLEQLKDLHIPRVFYFVNSNDEEWWMEHEGKFPAEPQENHHNVLCTERILPLPKVIRNTLIDEFCPDHLKEKARTEPSNKDCLARVYLGKRKNKDRIKPPMFFSLRNFNLHLDQLEGAKVHGLARLMGMALAVMHWKVGIDADDVEFVFGSSPTYPTELCPLSPSQVSSLPENTSTWKQANFKKRAIHLWMLDFNRCKNITRDEQGLKLAVQAFYRNDPYFPRPLSSTSIDRELWDTFVEEYVAMANEVLAEEDDDLVKALPKMFVEQCIAEQQRRMNVRAEADKRLATGTLG